MFKLHEANRMKKENPGAYVIQNAFQPHELPALSSITR